MIATPTRTLSTMKNTQKRCMKQAFHMPGTTLLETNVCIARCVRVAIRLETALHTIASSFGVYYHQMYLPRLNAQVSALSQSPIAKGKTNRSAFVGYHCRYAARKKSKGKYVVVPPNQVSQSC
jgi:hypothetical protein